MLFVVQFMPAKNIIYASSEVAINPLGLNDEPSLDGAKLFYDMEEIWKDIPDWEGFYQASNYGRIRSLDREINKHKLKGRVLVLRPDKDGYLKLNLWRNQIPHYRGSHRLVLSAFLYKSDLMVDHIDGDVTNNKLENLRYCNARENQTFSNVKKPNKTCASFGVMYRKDNGKFRARISIGGKDITIGHYDNEQDAADAYLKKLKELNNLSNE